MACFIVGRETKRGFLGLLARCPRNEGKILTVVGFQLNFNRIEFNNPSVASRLLAAFHLALSDALCNAACLFILRTKGRAR